MQINIQAGSLKPDMMYLQHLHGSEEENETNCPDATADTNHDGLVDITEAYEVAGITMIPFHDDPSSFEIKTETYPTANEKRKHIIPQDSRFCRTQDSLVDKFDWKEFDLTKFTYLIHRGDVISPECKGSSCRWDVQT